MAIIEDYLFSKASNPYNKTGIQNFSIIEKVRGPYPYLLPCPKWS